MKEKLTIWPTKKQWVYLAALTVACSIGAKVIETQSCVHQINNPRPQESYLERVVNEQKCYSNNYIKK